jgi:CRP-like cAMP-binding protein
LNAKLRAKVAELLVENGLPQTVPPNTVLFQAGDNSDDQGIVLIQGELSVEKEGNPGITAYAPDLLGEMAQLNPTRQRTATVTALTELSVLRFKWPAFTAAAQQTLTEDEVNAFTDALQQSAWTHFTQ